MKIKPILYIFLVLVLSITACVPMEASSPVIIVVTATSDPDLFVPSLAVAFVDTNRNVWLWKDDASLVPLVMTGNASDVQISDDGKVIAYQNTSGELHAVNADGSNDRALVDRNYLNSLIPFGGTTATIYTFNFIPNTHQIFFTVFVAGDVSGVDLFKVDVDTELRERVFAPGQGGNGNYFSPNGEWVVIAYPNQLILSRVNGTDARVVFPLPPLHGFSAHRGPDIVWEKDSSSFYVVVPLSDNDGNYVGTQRLFQVPVLGNPIPGFTFLALPFAETYISDNGENVASVMDDGDLINLHIITPGNGDVTYISDTEIGFFGWNPDSTHFVIWRNGQITHPLIGVVNEMPQPLTGDSNQVVDSFEWVQSDCFLFTSGFTLNLRYLLPADPANNPNVLVAQNVEPGRYDFTGICARP